MMVAFNFTVILSLSGDLGDQASSAGLTGSPFHSATASLFVAAQIFALQRGLQLMCQLPPNL
jgi:hypothetical protein